MTYVTVYLGLTNFKRLSVIRGADYSYGIYLYSFVIQQLFVYLAAPQSPFWWINAMVCVPLSALVAAFSWHFVEKPAQKM
ncbi:MAG: acyltransferase, partial [Methylocella sp.]